MRLAPGAGRLGEHLPKAAADRDSSRVMDVDVDDCQETAVLTRGSNLVRFIRGKELH